MPMVKHTWYMNVRELRCLKVLESVLLSKVMHGELPYLETRKSKLSFRYNICLMVQC